MNSTSTTANRLKTLEMHMRDTLSCYPENEWFTLDKLIGHMYGEFARDRDRSLDQVIRKKLIEWNWKCSTDFGRKESFVRRNHPTTPQIIKPFGQRMFATNKSWPPFSADTKQGASQSNISTKSKSIRQKLSRARKDTECT